MVGKCDTCKGIKNVTMVAPQFECSYYETEIRQEVKECEHYEKRTGVIVNTKAIQWAKNKRDKEKTKSQKDLIIFGKKFDLGSVVVGAIIGAIATYILVY